MSTERRLQRRVCRRPPVARAQRRMSRRQHGEAGLLHRTVVAGTARGRRARRRTRRARRSRGVLTRARRPSDPAGPSADSAAAPPARPAADRAAPPSPARSRRSPSCANTSATSSSSRAWRARDPQRAIERFLDQTRHLGVVGQVEARDRRPASSGNSRSSDRQNASMVEMRDVARGARAGRATARRRSPTSGSPPSAARRCADAFRRRPCA